LGNILVLDQFPATLRLGVALIAYGKDGGLLFIRMSRTHAWAPPVLEHETKVWFKPTSSVPELPGVYAGEIALPALVVDEPALYWLTVATEDGPTTRLPLYIAERVAWEEDHVANFAVIEHLPSGRLYFARRTPSGRIKAMSDELSQNEADAITRDPRTWPERAALAQPDWAHAESWRTVREIRGYGAS
jgi:hypothetical protein